MQSAFVPLARFRSLLTAQYYQAFLRVNGVHAFLANEHTAALCLPKFWFLSLEKRLHLLVPRTEQEQAMRMLQELIDCASATAEHPLEDDEIFPDEPPLETEPDRSGPRYLGKRIVLLIALIVLYRFAHAFWMRMM